MAYMNPATYMQWMNPAAYAIPGMNTSGAGGFNWFDPNSWANSGASGSGTMNWFDPNTWMNMGLAQGQPDQADEEEAQSN